MSAALSERIVGIATADAERGGLGFALAGVCGLEPSAYWSQFESWIAAGKHGSMAYLGEQAEQRLDPARLLAGARSAIVVADVYATRADGPDEPLGEREGRVARYARGKDYHQTMKRRLHALADRLRDQIPGSEFRTFVDIVPVNERELAVRAGLGWVGKHTLVIHPRMGSWFLLGGLLTTLELERPASQGVVTDHCGTCTRCIDACPTGAIEAYSVDARRCISYLTIEHRGEIEAGLAERLGGWFYGCDVCQEVCPHNSARGVETLPGEATRVHEAYAPQRDRVDLVEVLGWDEEGKRRALAGTGVKRATLEMLKRNAAALMKHRGDLSDRS